MYIGVDYYPEHWPRDRWEIDAQLMHEAGFNIVRLAEFAWVMIEPEEGLFKFDCLDNALDIRSQHGISAILGTPTAAMPAWAAYQYPDVMEMGANGEQVVWGVRGNNCFSLGLYTTSTLQLERYGVAVLKM